MTLLATMYTFTTYGTWLRGDRRGWVDEGRTLPPNPMLEQRDRDALKHAVFLFEESVLFDVGRWIGDSLRSRLQQRVLSMTVQTWHVHFIVGPSDHKPPEIVRCAKDAVRYGLRPGRPIWTDGYDKRFCFDERALRARIEYVERHNVAAGWPVRRWAFVEDC